MITTSGKAKTCPFNAQPFTLEPPLLCVVLQCQVLGCVVAVARGPWKDARLKNAASSQLDPARFDVTEKRVQPRLTGTNHRKTAELEEDLAEYTRKNGHAALSTETIRGQAIPTTHLVPRQAALHESAKGEGILPFWEHHGSAWFNTPQNSSVDFKRCSSCPRQKAATTLGLQKNDAVPDGLVARARHWLSSVGEPRGALLNLHPQIA